MRFGDYAVEAFPVEHRVAAFGYLLAEEQRPGRFDADRARELGVAEGPDFGRLQGGEAVAGSKGTVEPDQVVGEVRRGRRVAITGDTRPCDATAIAADGADLLIHDSSFADSEADRAAETGHSTARQAARVAAEAGVGMLALVHISARHFVPEILAEAREEFPATEAPRDFDLIELPLPERGGPVLRHEGALEGGGGARAERPEPSVVEQRVGDERRQPEVLGHRWRR